VQVTQLSELEEQLGEGYETTEDGAFTLRNVERLEGAVPTTNQAVNHRFRERFRNVAG